MAARTTRGRRSRRTTTSSILLRSHCWTVRSAGPEQLETERVRRDDVQELLARVEVRAAPDLTEAYPERTSARVHIALDDGREFNREQSDFEGSPTQPMSWERVAEKL